VDDDHRVAALKVLATPDTLLCLAIGGKHLEKGMSAIDTASNDKVLQPHFVIVDFKKKIAAGEIKEACDLLDEANVLSFAEIQRVIMIIKKHEGEIAKSYNVSEKIKMMQKKVERLCFNLGTQPINCTELNKQMSNLYDEMLKKP